jgi:hypothetical protein
MSNRKSTYVHYKWDQAGFALILLTSAYGYFITTDAPSYWIGGLALGLGVIGAVLLVKAVEYPPTVELEKPWIDSLNQFRDRSAECVDLIQEVYLNYRHVHQDLPATWNDLANLAPWPCGDEQYLHLWEAQVYPDAPQSAKQLYGFAKAVVSLPPHDPFSREFGFYPVNHVKDVDSFRRYVIDCFTYFADLREGGAKGFEGFLRSKAVPILYLNTLTLVAYLDLAKALHSQETIAGYPSRRPVNAGFWRLGKAWSPVTLASPSDEA